MQWPLLPVVPSAHSGRLWWGESDVITRAVALVCEMSPTVRYCNTKVPTFYSHNELYMSLNWTKVRNQDFRIILYQLPSTLRVTVSVFKSYLFCQAFSSYWVLQIWRSVLMNWMFGCCGVPLTRVLSGLLIVDCLTAVRPRAPSGLC